MMQKILIICTALLFGIGGVFLSNKMNPVPARPLIETKLSSTDGEAKSLADWRGQWRVVNFWADWCPPCKKEIPLLTEWQSKNADNSKTVIGVSFDDISLAKTSGESLGVNYPQLADERIAPSLAAELGNSQRVLPYTVLLSPANDVVFHHKGELNRKTLQEITDKIGDNNAN